MVPSGAFAYDVAGAGWKKYRERVQPGTARAEGQQFARPSFEAARRDRAPRLMLGVDGYIQS